MALTKRDSAYSPISAEYIYTAAVASRVSRVGRAISSYRYYLTGQSMDVPEIKNVLVENFRGIEPLNFHEGLLYPDAHSMDGATYGRFSPSRVERGEPVRSWGIPK